MIAGLKLSIYWGLQPVLLITAVGIWYADPTFELTYLYLIIGVQLVLGMIEHYSPARPEWLIRTRQKSINVILVFFLTLIALTLANFYVEWLEAPLAVFRNTVGLDIWPHHWPILAQLLMVFFASEFIWYWMHRSQHRFTWVWRLSGHGVHHSFKKLNALNFGLNHPIEYFFILLPSILVELIFGVGVAAAGASVLTVIQTSIVHSNINLNSRGIGWLFTTNRYHICHHSVDLVRMLDLSLEIYQGSKACQAPGNGTNSFDHVASHEANSSFDLRFAGGSGSHIVRLNDNTQQAV